jgi:hypothetical protein
MIEVLLDGTTPRSAIRRWTPHSSEGGHAGSSPSSWKYLGAARTRREIIIHRADPKPANIYLCPKPGGVDFVKSIPIPGSRKFNVLNDEHDEHRAVLKRPITCRRSRPGGLARGRSASYPASA